jgi:hypothetical protein
MTEPKLLDQNIRALQQWLDAAWRQLGDPSLTAFSRRELRNQMKQCSADLRNHLQAAAQRQAQAASRPAKSFTKPELRILAWS